MKAAIVYKKLVAVWGSFNTCTSDREPDGGGASTATFTELPECEFCFEHGLALQSSSLSNEQMVVVALERRFVNIKHFVPQMEGHAELRKRRLEVWKAE